jgi:hypothetical protein
MDRLQKCELAKKKGYRYNVDTGEIYGIRGNTLKKKTNGYITLQIQYKPKIELYGHHFAWYMTYDNVDFEILDHINRIKTDNRISNLRKSNTQKNAFNKNVKGYNLCKKTKKWKSQIKIDGKQIHLGYYEIEEEAKQAYLLAKEKYHII